MWEQLWIAFAMVLIIEGLGPLLFPNKWRNYIVQLTQLPLGHLRQLGGILVVVGGFILFYQYS